MNVSGQQQSLTANGERTAGQEPCGELSPSERYACTWEKDHDCPHAWDAAGLRAAIRRLETFRKEAEAKIQRVLDLCGPESAQRTSMHIVHEYHDLVPAQSIYSVETVVTDIGVARATLERIHAAIGDA